MTRSLDIAVTPWDILDGGILTGKYNQTGTEPRRYDKAGERSLKLAEEVVKLAREIDRTPAQVAINWVRQQQSKAQIIPILGARREAQIQDNLACLEWELTAEQMAGLDEVSRIDLGFPHAFLYSAHVKNLLHGETYAHLDNHRA
jgi:aryl-alcohol dehydrogenase-like predicted oxidoreductase